MNNNIIRPFFFCGAVRGSDDAPIVYSIIIDYVWSWLQGLQESLDKRILKLLKVRKRNIVWHIINIAIIWELRLVMNTF